MRKTRLVILPTKCLHQMGFLLLFLSCPAIGDWGRIRPESETSHDAIRIEKEGTCGLQRDSPGGILDILDANGFNQCRRSESNDLKEPTTREAIYGNRFDSSRKIDVRESLLRRAVNERRGGEVERNLAARRELRNARERLTSQSRSVEARRTSAVRSQSLERRNDDYVRSFSRLDDKSRGMRRTRSVETRARQEVSNEARDRRDVINNARTQKDVSNEARVRGDVTNDVRARREVTSKARARRDVTSEARVRRDVTNDLRARREVTNGARVQRQVAAERASAEQRLSLARRTLERENERKVELQKRIIRENRNERRENERTIRVARERRERESNEKYLRRSTERRDLERRETQREHDERLIERLAISRRESMSRQVPSEKKNVIQPKYRRLSLARVEQDKTRKVERSENQRILDTERRVADIRKSQSLEVRRSIDEFEKSFARKADARRKIEIRRTVSLPRKLLEDERPVSHFNEKMERLEGLSWRGTSRLNAGLKKEMFEDIKLGEKTPEDEKFFSGIMKRMGLKYYPAFEVRDWTTNCVIGVAAYLIHSRKVKAA